jgi:hypothetical protein
LSLANDAFDNDGSGVVNDAGETASGTERIVLAVRQDPGSPTNPVYAALAATTGDDWLMGVFRSIDQGATWNLLGPGSAPPPASKASLATVSLIRTNLQITAANTITRPSGNFVKDGFVAGQILTIAGSTAMPTDNNGTYHVAAVTPGAITLVENTLTLEGPTRNLRLTADFELSFVDSNPDTISRTTAAHPAGVGSFLDEGFMPGQTFRITGSANNNARYVISGVTATTLTLANDISMAETATGGVRFEVSVTEFPTNAQPQVSRGSQASKHLSLSADAAGNVYLGGDRPPHVFVWDIVNSAWRPIVESGARATAAHADSRAIVFDNLGRLIEVDDGGIYRLSAPNPNLVPAAVMTGSPNVRFRAVDGGPDELERNAGLGPAGDWIADGFRVGQVITVSDPRLPDNERTFSIAALTATTITLSDGEAVTAEFSVRPQLEIVADPILLGNPTLTFADTNPDTIARPLASGTWVDDGFAVGQQIVVAGSVTVDGMGSPASNDGIYTITAISGDELTLTVDGELFAESRNNISVRSTRMWTSLNNGLGVTEILSASYDPLNNVIFAGTQDNYVIEQPPLNDGVDNDGDGDVDEDDERLRWEEVVLVSRPGDGNTTEVIPIDSEPDGTFDQTLRISMSNNLNSLGSRLFDANGDLVAGSDNRIPLAGSANDIRIFQVLAGNNLRIVDDTGTPVPHGFADGAGPFNVYATVGLGPAGDPELPGGLSPTRSYFVHFVDANRFQLATSRTRALAGNEVAITSDGAGMRLIVNRFSGLVGSDLQKYTSRIGGNPGFKEQPFVVNAVDSTRMAIGLDRLYVSENVGTAADPDYRRLDIIESITDAPVTRYAALAYGATSNPDVLYGVSRNFVVLVVPNALQGSPDLTFTRGVIGGARDTIARAPASGSWLDEGFGPGQTIVISGTGSANDRTFQVHSVTATNITLKAHELVAAGTFMNARVDFIAKERIGGAIEVTDVVLDPDDWKVAYVTADSDVYARTGTNTWTRISQNLLNFNLDTNRDFSGHQSCSRRRLDRVRPRIPERARARSFLH